MRTIARAAVVLAALGAGACTSDADLRCQAREAGRAAAETDFRAGTAEPRIGCGTIAPGACGSVAEERYGQWFGAAYNERLRELTR